MKDRKERVADLVSHVGHLWIYSVGPCVVGERARRTDFHVFGFRNFGPFSCFRHVTPLSSFIFGKKIYIRASLKD